jgi:hypothetical protein
MQHHNYSLTELDNMLPWERAIYIALLTQYIKDENEKAIVDTAMKDEAAGTVPPIQVADKDDGKELRYAALQENNAEIQAAKEDIECWYFFINQIFSKLLFCNYS